MAPVTYRNLIHHLGLSQVRAAAAFGYARRAGQRWAADGPPAAVAILVRLLYAGKITLGDVAGALRPEDRR